MWVPFSFCGLGRGPGSPWAWRGRLWGLARGRPGSAAGCGVSWAHAPQGRGGDAEAQRGCGRLGAAFPVGPAGLSPASRPLLILQEQGQGLGQCGPGLRPPRATRGDPSTLGAPGGGGWPGDAGSMAGPVPQSAYVEPPLDPHLPAPAMGGDRCPWLGAGTSLWGQHPEGQGSRRDAQDHPVRTAAPDPGTPTHAPQQALVIPGRVTGGRKPLALCSLRLVMTPQWSPSCGHRLGALGGWRPRRPLTRPLKIIGLPRGKGSTFPSVWLGNVSYSHVAIETKINFQHLLDI